MVTTTEPFTPIHPPSRPHIRRVTRSAAERRLIDDGAVIDAWLEARDDQPTLVVLAVDVDGARVALETEDDTRRLTIVPSQWTAGMIREAETTVENHPRLISVGSEITDEGQYRVLVSVTWVDQSLADQVAEVPDHLLRLAPMMVPLGFGPPP